MRTAAFKNSLAPADGYWNSENHHPPNLSGSRSQLLACYTVPLALSSRGRKSSEPMILSPPIERAPTILSAPIELAGNWGRMVSRSAETVVERMRHACLDGVRLVSDRQPTRIRVDRHTSGPPAIWLHPDGSSMAWIIVDTGERAWMQLAYQFGHELGHVMANSWQPHAKPLPPSHWLEEALVEAFTLRGLGRLAESWKTNPPFPGDNQFGDGIAKYRQNITRLYKKLAGIFPAMGG